MTPKTKSLTKFRKELDETLQDAGRGQAYLISQPGKVDTVLLSRKEYERILDECVVLRAIADGMSDIAAGRVYTHDEVLSFLAERRAKWKSTTQRKRATALQKSKSSSLRIHPPRRRRSSTA
jgi:PHD/YefM family antitoxin component YafN of YafNO toxin-antitoxin module